MLRYCFIIILLLNCAMSVLQGNAQDKVVFLREDFNNLEDWKPLHFQKIKEHTKYSIVKDGDESYVKAESMSSASGIIFKIGFSVFEYPKVKWRWKISNVYKKGNATEKSGDDYPIRVYIIFKYDPESASFGKRIRFGLAKTIYGEYPPHSTLNYIWANRPHLKSIITNTYAAEAKMILLQTGAENAGKWVEQEVNIFEDYHKVFREDPPAIASIAIMNDSDNTGESAVSYIDYIEVYR